MTRFLLPLLVLLAAPLARGEASWQPFAETEVIEILSVDEDGKARETKVWIVVLDDQGYVRTNASRWLANIRRGSPVKLRSGEQQWVVKAEEASDPETTGRVEEAFKEKYGTLQSVMSFFRLSEPTVLRLHFVAAPA